MFKENKSATESGISQTNSLLLCQNRMGGIFALAFGRRLNYLPRLFFTEHKKCSNSTWTEDSVEYGIRTSSLEQELEALVRAWDET